MSDTEDIRAKTFARLRWPLRLTHAGLWAERLARGFWPVWTVVLGAGGLVSLGVLERLPQAWFSGLGAIAAVLVAGFTARGILRFKRPTRAEALARLDATMPGRPLAALSDVQAIGLTDPASAEVWRIHRDRMAERARAARAPLPDPGLKTRDPYALRYSALLLALIALGFGSVSRIAGIAGLGPQGAQALAAGPVWEGWIRPPAYTGKPVLYLNDIRQEALELPQGSRVILRFYGEPGAIGVQETVSGAPLPDAQASQSAEFLVESHGRIEITGPGGRVWDIAALRDLPPRIESAAPPEREADGRMKLPFTATDDYGVTGGTALITLDMDRVDRRYGLEVAPEPREAVRLDLPLPFRGRRTEVSETLLEDLSKHPFANLPVRIRLAVEDAAGQTYEAADLLVDLPGRRFFDPLAAAVAEARRDLLWSAENTARTAQVLRAVTHLPEDFIRNERAFLRLRVVIRQLEAAPILTAETRDAITEELWTIALLMEEGDLASALERLKRAQDRLDQAMKNGASQSEIDGLMQDLRAALDSYMQQLAKESAQDPNRQMSDLEGMQMSGDQLQEMLDKLQELMQQGRMAEAMELMEMLRQLMENMQVVQGEGGGQGENRMRDLSDTLREQQDLSDETFRELQEQFDRQMRQFGQQGQPEARPGEGSEDSGGTGEGGTGGGSMAERQGDLRGRLGALGGAELPGDGSERAEAGRRALDRSRRAMEGAEEALRGGDLPRALDRQAEAMEALREGMRDFNEAMAEERRQNGGQGAEGERFGREGQPSGRRDPLGREPGESGRIGSEENMLQGEDPYRRAQDLLRELRRRSGEQERSEEERDYLRRLLDPF